MNINISYSSDEPIYQQIVNQVKQQILNGELKPGDSIPSIRQLAKELRVSVITTKRAYEELEREGLIESFVGRGSFVAEKNLDDLRRQRMKRFEDQFSQLIREGKELSLSLEELQDLLRRFYGEEPEK